MLNRKTSDMILEYINSLPDERKKAIKQLQKTILENLPEGFEETITDNMISYVVPHTIYPKGYHCNPNLPLPFASIASQKYGIAFYHMGLYSDNKLLNWFKEEYLKFTEIKLDMGKSCIRFKKIEQIPYELIGKLMAKLSVEEWVNLYEANIKK